MQYPQRVSAILPNGQRIKTESTVFEQECDNPENWALTLRWKERDEAYITLFEAATQNASLRVNADLSTELRVAKWMDNRYPRTVDVIPIYSMRP